MNPFVGTIKFTLIKLLVPILIVGSMMLLISEEKHAMIMSKILKGSVIIFTLATINNYVAILLI